LKDQRVYLKHILDCIRRIERNVSSGKDAFFTTEVLQDAILRNLQVMAESTQRLPESVKAEYPEIEWARIAAFRNLLVHDYLGIDVERVWEIIHRDVPGLKAAVLSALAK
jgi:uncharacterized protein with HEPN domain